MGKKLMFVLCTAGLLAAGTGVVRGGLQDGLVAYFQLDEESGAVAADASGNGHEGTLYGQGVEWIPGYSGGGLSCATAVDEGGVEFPTAGMSATAGTVSLWAYLTEPQAARTRYFFGHTTARPPAAASYADRIQIYMNSGVNTLSLGLGDTHARKTDIVSLATRKWHHIVLTWNNGNYVVYANGNKVAEGTYTGLTALDPVASISDDCNPDEHEAFDGVLDEARMYNRALSADEVKQLSQIPAAPRIRAWGPKPADGANDVMVPLFSWKSVDAIKQHNVYVGTDPNLTAANLASPRLAANTLYYIPGVQPGKTYFWRVDEIEADLTTIHPGTVWSFIARDMVAYAPTPADGANTASPACVLTWLPGIGASAHHLYLGDNLDAVTQGAADTDKGTLEEASFTPTDLQSATRYFWRVDEMVGMAVKPGPVWSFTTCVPVDDFESYNDEEGQGTRLYETWIDGYSDGSSGSTVGNLEPPFAEQAIVHGGKQSMPMDYNNVNEPFFSEAYREFSPAQDWTAEDTDTLVLYVRGKARNSAAPLYLIVKDTSNHTAVVTHPEPAAVKAVDWVEWKIPLSDLTVAGVKVTAVKRLTVGVGDKANPVAGGAGLLYIDDIILTKPTPATE